MTLQLTPSTTAGSVSCVSPAPTSDEPTHPQRILVAEDDAGIRECISRALSKDGFAVDAVADGEAAWESILTRHYDLLVTDNDMPRLEGMTLVKRVRDWGIQLPVIMASGSFLAGEAGPKPQLQIAAFLPKPFATAALLATVRLVLEV